MGCEMDNKKILRIFIPRAGFYLWVIFLIITIVSIRDFIFYGEYKWGIPFFLFFIFLVFYNYRTSHKKKKEIVKYIENLSFNVNSATKDTLLKFSLPLVVLELDGKIVWYNSLFRKIFENESEMDKSIKQFMDFFTTPNDTVKSKGIEWNTKVGERYYKVSGNLINTQSTNDDEEDLMILYFSDVSEFEELKQKYQDEKSAVGIIMIDNYDELMQSIDDFKRPLMLAEIEKKVSSWMEYTNGLLRKYERDKYLFIFESVYIKDFETNKFDILENIKEINIGNKIPVTLSLGVGLNSSTIIDNFRNASTAVDIALSRGGDHAVIRDYDEYKFYGGKTRELEKRTRVKARVVAYALKDLIDSAPAVLIMGHEHCDADCLGAAMGIYRIACSRNKEARIVLNTLSSTVDKLVNKIKKDPEFNELFIDSNRAMDVITPKTLLIVVDTHRPSYTECPELIKMTEQIVVIDHHRRGADYISDAVITYQETYASSTCELVTEILQYVDDRLKLHSIEAEALYAGIVVDTKNFMFKTGVRTFEAASYLRRHGVDTIGVRALFQSDFDTYVSISNVIKEAEILKGGIAISTCPHGIKNPQLIAAQAADQLQTLAEINAAFVMGFTNGEVFISGRSLGEINVQVIMEKLGGGGHMTGAGAQLRDVSLSEAKDKLKKVINEVMSDKQKD